MSYPLPDSARAFQAKVRDFVDNIDIPCELECEENSEAGEKDRH
jgi:hypothetical protein